MSYVEKPIGLAIFLGTNCLLHDVIEKQIMEVKGIGRRRIQLLDYLRNKRIYCKLKEEGKEPK